MMFLSGQLSPLVELSKSKAFIDHYSIFISFCLEMYCNNVMPSWFCFVVAMLYVDQLDFFKGTVET